MDLMYFLFSAVSSRKKVSARAVDDASVPVREACSALCFWLHVDYLA